jgi:hypothetical protein
MNVIPFTAFIEAVAMEDSSATEQQQQVAAAWR